MVAVTQHIFKGHTASTRWHDMIENLFGAGDNSVDEGHRFSGQIRHSALGQLGISKVVSSREVSRRTQRHVSNDARDTYVLVNGVVGEVSLQQGAARAQIIPHSFAFYCASRAYEWQHMNLTAVRNVAVPGHLLRARLRNIDQYTCRTFADTVGMWRILTEMVDASLGELEAIPEAASHQLGAQLADLLALALEGDGRLALSEPSSRKAVYQRCVGFIRGNIVDASLGPDLIASTIGISVRSLHRMFAEMDSSVTDCIREERLSASLTHLRNPANAAIPISEIAYRTGFRNHSHFSHAFRSKFGMTPSDWRRTQG